MKFELGFDRGERAVWQRGRAAHCPRASAAKPRRGEQPAHGHDRVRVRMCRRGRVAMLAMGWARARCEPRPRATHTLRSTRAVRSPPAERSARPAGGARPSPSRTAQTRRGLSPPRRAQPAAHPAFALARLCARRANGRHLLRAFLQRQPGTSLCAADPAPIVGADILNSRRVARGAARRPPGHGCACAGRHLDSPATLSTVQAARRPSRSQRLS